MRDKVDKLKGWFAEQNDYRVTISRVYHTAPSRLRNPILIPSLTSTVHHLPSPSFVEGLTLPPSSTNWRLSKWRIGWKLPLPYKFIVWSKSDLLNPVSDTTKLESNAASSSLFSIRDFAPGLDSGGATNLMAATKSCHRCQFCPPKVITLLCIFTQTFGGSLCVCCPESRFAHNWHCSIDSEATLWRWHVLVQTAGGLRSSGMGAHNPGLGYAEGTPSPRSRSILQRDW